MPILSSRIASSRYLSKLERQSPTLKGAPTEKLLELLDGICAQLQYFNVDQVSVSEAEQTLLDANASFNYLWGLAELQKVGDQEQRGRHQTKFAEVSIDYALRLAWRVVAEKNKTIKSTLDTHKGKMPGLFIFGMGKLGGYDLNFSSDVDLVAYFDPLVLPIADAVGKSYICHQVLQKLTQFLNQGGESTFVWRVDWRLRPNASATTLAMSTVAAVDYYFYRASPWHRLALMKARVIAGDTALGELFLANISPFIWRQNLDYRALDELAEIKQRINLEHPSLRTQRQWREPIGDQIEGFNVKLGSGGIREIEFIANALQLVWGGRRVALRTSHTITAINELVNYQHINRSDADLLIKYYQLLRGVENAIQLLDNQQTHLIPSDEKLKGNLLSLLAIESWSTFVESINQARRFVNTCFEELFSEQEAAQQPAPVWLEGLSAQADEIIDHWEAGYQVYGVSIDIRHRLLPLTRALAHYVAQDVDNANDTIVRLHEFFRALPKGGQYFRLLAESPRLLNKFVPPLLYSPPMASLLKQSPHIIDCYVHGQWSYPDEFDSRDVLQTEHYELQLERIRRFVNEHLYQLYLCFFEGELDVETFQIALTELAEHTLELALSIVAKQMNLSKVPITVIGMGKVALRRMSPLSDLDLIFVFDPDDVSLEIASRFVSRLQTAISTPMREGIVYELDTRLRPSGRSGAPVVSIESFAVHHRERAHTWEHIALMPSRVVAGNKALIEKIDEIKQTVISSPREHDQLMRDALKMWNRIMTHRISDGDASLMNSKLAVGGLMQSEYLAACLILRHHGVLGVDDVSFEALLSQSLAGSGVADLLEIIQFWRIQQLWERLLGKTGEPLESISTNYLKTLLAQSGVDSLEQLIDKKKRYAAQVDGAMKQFFADYSMTQKEIDDWIEVAVQWSV